MRHRIISLMLATLLLARPCTSAAKRRKRKAKVEEIVPPPQAAPAGGPPPPWQLQAQQQHQPANEPGTRLVTLDHLHKQIREFREIRPTEMYEVNVIVCSAAATPRNKAGSQQCKFTIMQGDTMGSMLGTDVISEKRMNATKLWQLLHDKVGKPVCLRCPGGFGGSDPSLSMTKITAITQATGPVTVPTLGLSWLWDMADLEPSEQLYTALVSVRAAFRPMSERDCTILLVQDVGFPTGLTVEQLANNNGQVKPLVNDTVEFEVRTWLENDSISQLQSDVPPSSDPKLFIPSSDPKLFIMHGLKVTKDQPRCKRGSVEGHSIDAVFMLQGLSIFMPFGHWQNKPQPDLKMPQTEHPLEREDGSDEEQEKNGSDEEDEDQDGFGDLEMEQ